MTLPPISPWTLTAHWLFPVSQPPLENGTITISDDRIVAVEPHGSRTADIDLGNTAILPGLVNAHTHLDLSGLRGKCPPTPDFIDWLRAVIRHRRTQSPEQIQSGIRSGLDECLHSGTTLLGDISAGGTSWETLSQAPVRALVFRELIGLRQDQIREMWIEDVIRWKQGREDHHTCRIGMSPHAPYSTNAAIIRSVAWNGWPMTIHLAETFAELELLEHHSGPFVPFLEELGVWNPGGLAPSIDWILRRTRRSPNVIYAHCNYLPSNVPIPPNGTIIYCPRTHAAFGHPPHPFREFLARGIRVALGTDSLASNPDLDVLAEARFVHQKYPDVLGATILRMATLSGAEALGWQNETGSLEPGKSADLIVLPLPNEESNDPHRLILESPLPVQKVLWRGNWR